MKLLIVEQTTDPSDYATIPIAFDVRERLDLAAVRVAQPLPTPCRTIPIARPFTKDYDAIAGNRPADWSSHDDCGPWRCVTAIADDVTVGRAAFAVRDGEATLWDIRVAPDFRGRGIGSELLAVVEGFARPAGARRVIAETQDINVPACRFYARHGYVIRTIQPLAYPELPDEVCLVWRKVLS
jgi:ribosomal protein S18 acetylase RimI-like enzyme